MNPILFGDFRNLDKTESVSGRRAAPHQKGGAGTRSRQTLELSAGKDNVKTGHFYRFAHDKILIKKDESGKAIKVLTGSANFSVRGLYVQANNVSLRRPPNGRTL